MSQSQRNYSIGAILLIASGIVRYISASIITADYTNFLSKWFIALDTPGLRAFKIPFSDYTPLYLYLIKVLTHIPAYSLYSIKNLSFVFDIGIAIGITLIVREYLQRDDSNFNKNLTSRLFLTFAIALSIPTVVINSSLWAQSDSVYAAGIIFSLFFMLKDKPALSVLFFSFAISDKLQAIFFLPVLVGYLCRQPKRLWLLFIVPGFFALTIVPAWIGGGNFTTLFKTYLMQSGEQSALALNAPSIFSFVSTNISTHLNGILSLAGIIVAAIASVFIAITIFSSKNFKQLLVPITLFAVLIIPFFLPHMHERYFYLADVFAITYALIYPRLWFVPTLVVAASLGSYANYLKYFAHIFYYIAWDERFFTLLMAIAAIFTFRKLFTRATEESITSNLFLKVE